MPELEPITPVEETPVMPTTTTTTTTTTTDDSSPPALAPLPTATVPEMPALESISAQDIANNFKGFERRNSKSVAQKPIASQLSDSDVVGEKKIRIKLSSAAKTSQDVPSAVTSTTKSAVPKAKKIAAPVVVAPKNPLFEEESVTFALGGDEQSISDSSILQVASNDPAAFFNLGISFRISLQRQRCNGRNEAFAPQHLWCRVKKRFAF